MGPNAIMAIGFAVVGVICLLAVFLGRLFQRNQPPRCPRCAEFLIADPYRYKGVVHWECQGCGATYETLR